MTAITILKSRIEMATVQIFGKNKCFDTKKAQRYFKERRISFQYIDLGERNLSRGELHSVLTAIGGYEKLLNKKSPSAQLVEYLAYDEDKEEKFLQDASLYITPIVRLGKSASIGYTPEVWEQWNLQ